MTKLEKLLGKENAKILLDSAYDLDKSLPYLSDFVSYIEHCEDSTGVVVHFLVSMAEKIKELEVK